MRSRTRIGAVLAAFAVAGGLVAGLVASSASTAASTPAWLAKVDATVQAAYKGTEMVVPPGPKGVTGKTIWDISCTLTIPDCANASAGVDEGGKALGWNVTTVDNGTNPITAGQQIEQAIAAHADGIVVIGIDCSAIENPLTAAQSANIPTITIGGAPCSTKTPNFTANTVINGLPFVEGQAVNASTDRIDWAISQTHGNLKVIDVDIPDFTPVVATNAGALKALKACPTCKVVDTVNLSIQNVTALAQLLPAALNAYPSANAVYLYSGSALLTGAETAIKNSGRATGKNRLLVISSEGVYGEPGLIRQGWDIGTAAFSLNWNGWQADDFLNRLFHGVKASQLPTSGAGIQLFDATHNLPKGSTWSPPINYEAAYAKEWGVKG